MVTQIRTLPRWQFDPLCPVDWRARDAGHLIGGRRAQWAEATDSIVAAYVDYLRAVSQASSEADQRRVEETCPAIHTAHKLAQQDSLGQWELKARLLAQQSDEEIARRLGLSPEAVGMYERLFFNFGYCLHASGYIAGQVIGTGLNDGFHNEELGQLWMAFGYFGGPVVLDASIEAFRAVWRRGEPQTLSTYLRSGTGIDPNLQALVAATVLPPYGTAGKAWMAIHLRLMEADAVDDPDRRAFLRARVQNDLIRCGRAFLAGQPLPTFKRKPRRPHGTDHEEMGATACVSAAGRLQRALSRYHADLHAGAEERVGAKSQPSLCYSSTSDESLS
jgi:hypothetical protein